MLDISKLSFIQDYINNNVVNVVYRNNDFINFLSDAFLKMSETLGFTGDNISNLFLTIYFAFLLLFLGLFAVLKPFRFFEKIFGIFIKKTYSKKAKKFVRSDIIQMFIVSFIVALMLAPAKMQYVQLVPYVSSSTELPKYRDLNNSHKKGQEINTLAIIAFTAWFHNRFVFGIQTSKGEVIADKEISNLSLNGLFPSYFHKLFAEVNKSIDGYKYVKDYLYAFKDREQNQQKEYNRYNNVINSQFSIFLGLNNKIESSLNRDIRNFYTKSNTNILNDENSNSTKLIKYLIEESSDSVSTYQKVKDRVQNAEGFWDTAGAVLGTVGDGLSYASRKVGDGVMYVAKEATFNNDYASNFVIQMNRFNEAEKEGLNALKAHIRSIADIQSQENKNLKESILKYTRYKDNTILHNSNAKEYIEKLNETTKYFQEEQYIRLLQTVSDSFSQDTEVKKGLLKSDFSTDEKISEYFNLYFSKILKQKEREILHKINISSSDFKKGLTSIFLLSHTNFLDSISQDENERNEYVKKMFKLSTMSKTTEEFNQYLLSYRDCINKLDVKEHKEDIEVCKTVYKFFKDGIKANHILSNDVGINQKEMIDNIEVFNNYNKDNKINVDFSNIVNNNTLNNSIYKNIEDTRVREITGQKLQYTTQQYINLDIFNKLMIPLTEFLIFENMFLINNNISKSFNFTNREIRARDLMSNNLKLKCNTHKNSSVCSSLTDSNLLNNQVSDFVNPNGIDNYINLDEQSTATTPIQRELNKINLILEAYRGVKKWDIKTHNKHYAERILLDAYQDLLTHFKGKNNTDTIKVSNIDEMNVLYTFITKLESYLLYLSKTNQFLNRAGYMIPIDPLEIIRNQYFYPNAMAYFYKFDLKQKIDNTVKSNKEVIENLYNFIDPKNNSEYSLVFGKFLTQNNILTREKLSKNILTKSSEDAYNDFEYNFNLMTDLQVKATSIKNIDGMTILEQAKEERKKSSFVNSAIAKLSSVYNSMLDMLAYVEFDYANHFADTALKYIAMPYNYIFGKNDILSSFNDSIRTAKKMTYSKIYHMDKIKLSYLPKASRTQKVLSVGEEYKEVLGDIVITAATFGTAGGVFGFSKVMTKLASAGKLGFKAVKIGGKVIKRVINPFKGFRKMSHMRKMGAIILFLGALPVKVFMKILNKLIVSLFYSLIVMGLLFASFKFVFTLLYKLILPLSVGLSAVAYNVFIYPISYLYKDTLSQYVGSFEELNDKLVSNIWDKVIIVAKLYTFYVLTIMLFIAIYKFIMIYTVDISMYLMFAYQSFDLSISIFVLSGFWITTHIMNIITNNLIPDTKITDIILNKR